ncbi:MAG TPA: MerR family transcriptional regulator [Thermoanaerobaculia bacterium]|nr:MerR family transcriptional regulator [Thermoanaerobaculia bacterium]
MAEKAENAEDAAVEPGGEPLRAGELARRAGVSKDTLRFYERRGLLPRPRRLANNYRLYPPEALAQVLWIRRVLALGFTVEEIAPILAERNAGGAPCRQVRELGATKLAAMEERLRELTAACAALRELLAEWDHRLAGRHAGERVGLLEDLPDAEPRSASRKIQPKTKKKRKGIP